MPRFLTRTLIVAGIGGAWTHGYTTGKSAEKTMHMQRLAALFPIVYRDRIRYVDRVIDDCADVPVPDGVFSALGGRDGQ